MKTSAVGNTIPPHEVTRLVRGRTFLSGKVILSPVREHKLLQAAFLYNGTGCLAMACRGMLGQSYPVPAGWLPSPSRPSWWVPLSSQGHELAPAQPSSFTTTHRAAPPPPGQFQQAVHEPRNKANASTCLGSAYKATFLNCT